MKRDKYRKLRDALRRVQQSDKALHALLFSEFPAGSRVAFKGARGIVYPAMVIGHAMGRVCVKNLHTGNRLWIRCSQLHGA